jgi:DHA1 family tetracycline resistance protein-like MFS transporter
LTSQYIGYILAYVGVLSAVTQGVLVGQLVKRFSDRQLLFGGMIAMTVGMVGWAIAPNIPTLLLAMLPLAVAGGTLNTVLQAALSKTVAPMEVGGILGISASLESFTRVLAPTIGGLLIGQLGTYAPGIFGGLLLVYVSWYVYRNVFPKMYTSEGSQPLSIPVE